MVARPGRCWWNGENVPTMRPVGHFAPAIWRFAQHGVWYGSPQELVLQPVRNAMENKVVTCRLTDGREVLLRSPAVDKDLDRLLAFYAQLPPAVKNHLRYDVGKDREVGSRRLRQLDGQNHWRIVAEAQDGNFVADGTMDREMFGWTRHIADIRAVVEPAFENLGLREAICEELVRLAQKAGVERLQTEVLAEHESFITFLEQQGFTREFTRKGYAKAIDGKLHDVIIMSNDLESVWKHLEDHIHDMDISFSRWSGGYE
jgi:ribosomal protein S18 acetylase RimI-like enzyme